MVLVQDLRAHLLTRTSEAAYGVPRKRAMAVTLATLQPKDPLELVDPMRLVVNPLINSMSRGL